MQKTEVFKVIPETQVYVTVADAMHATSTTTNGKIPLEHQTNGIIPLEHKTNEKIPLEHQTNEKIPSGQTILHM